MQITAGQLYKELDEKKWRPFYLVVGEEPFQAAEITAKLKAFFLKDDAANSFNYEAWDGEHLDVSGLLSSLDTLPGLFDGPDTLRLVSCTRFEKVSPSNLEGLEKYFRDPSPTTSFLILCAKADKRKTWYKAVEQRGALLEVNEPFDREWPRWQGYFERKLQKKIEADAWVRLLESSNRSLSLLWSELQKAATFVGEAPAIKDKDILALGASEGAVDVFDFVADVVSDRAFVAMEKFNRLLQSGENEIKLLALLVRQFRQVKQCLELMKKGITEPKVISVQIGAHPFFVSKVLQQARCHSTDSLAHTLNLLAESDFRMKTGEGGLFDNFLVPYFSKMAALRAQPKSRLA